MAYVLSNVFLPVWLARSSHDLAGPCAEDVRRARPVPVKVPLGGWPLPVTAVVLPLFPVAANLVHGMPFWIGPRGVVESAVRAHLTQLWLCFDLLVGVGGLGLLVLVAVTRRTHRFVWVTVCVLLVAAVVGVVTAATTRETGSYTAAELSNNNGFAFLFVGSRTYPDWMFHPVEEGGAFAFGVSPLWHSAAFVASALILISLYGRGQARRSPYRVVAACLASVAVLCLLPVVDQARGPVTTAGDCAPSEPGVDMRTLDATLAGICPPAAADVKAGSDAEERETLERAVEEQRKCDEAPRHHPLIRPVSLSRHREPLWAERGILEVYEETEDAGDPFADGLLDLTQENGLVAALPGHLMIRVHPDLASCVTTETYTRRPPVETGGWHHVVEVGYDSPGGEIKLRDPMDRSDLPDLAVRGRGDYRIRVHHAWLPWKGDRYAGQRLLIMAYPGRGDDVVVHRARTKP
ncbi:hypothetical protein ACSDR0_02085 [Streptosporangium sp. G11]|uniref:hypothetical protein n=1 Tax=Streptosporangium sp. G11 TaxID=3436926 RepID=UPI003EBBCC13